MSLAGSQLFSQTAALPENPYTEVRGDGPSNKQPIGALKPTPRTPDGKPDLSGFWKGPLIFGAMFKSVGGPPFTPAGEAAAIESGPLFRPRLSAYKNALASRRMTQRSMYRVVMS